MMILTSFSRADDIFYDRNMIKRKGPVFRETMHEPTTAQ